jgi:hypothetical protein
MKPYRQLANELTGIRAKIRELKDREEELRNILLADGADLVGSQYEAVVQGRAVRLKKRHKRRYGRPCV